MTATARPADYLVAVEREFTRLRGGAPLLTPADWDVVRRWERRGIPLEAALEGIRVALDRSLRASPRMPLRRCESAVEAAAATRRRRTGGASAPRPAASAPRPAASWFRPAASSFRPAAAAPPRPDPVVVLSGYRTPTGLGADPETAARIEALAREAAIEIRDVLRGARAETPSVREARLEAAWAALLDRLGRSLPPAVRADVHRGAVAALSGHRERMPERSWRRAVREAARRRIARQLGLPSSPPSA